MKIYRRIICSLLCVIIATTGFICIAQDKDCDAEAFVLKHGIIRGDENGLRLNDKITRAEFCVILCRILKLAPDFSQTPFRDLNSSHWCSGYINALYDEGIFKALDEEEVFFVETDDEGRAIEFVKLEWVKDIARSHRLSLTDEQKIVDFYPDDDISCEEALKLLIKSIGYDEVYGIKTFEEKAVMLELVDDADKISQKNITRQDIVNMIFKALQLKTIVKNNNDGNIEYKFSDETIFEKYFEDTMQTLDCE